MRLKVFAISSPAFAHFQKLGREFFWIGLGQGLAALGGIVGVRLLTNMLDPTSYGELALGMTVATLVQQLALGPLSGAFLRFFAPSYEANQLGAYLRGVQVLLGRVTIILLAVGGLFSLGLWAFGYTEWLALALAALIFSLFFGYNAVLNGMQNAARQRVVVAWHQGLGQWLRFLIAVALMAVLGAFSSVAMIGYALAFVVVLSSQLLFFRRKILPISISQPAVESDDVGDWTRKMLGYAWPFATWGLFTWAQMSSDRWALQAFGVTSDVGFYAVLYQLGYYPITLLSGLIVQLVAPILFDRAGDGADSARLNHTHQMNNLVLIGAALLTVLGTIFTFLLHTQIFSLLVALEFREVSFLLPWMVLSGGLFACGQVAVLSVLSGVNPRGLVMPKIVTALLGITLNFTGAYWLGLRGVVFANVTFSLVYLIWILYLARPSGVLGVSQSVGSRSDHKQQAQTILE
jgi:O-antigen/teichoic acid export membrane protein